MTFSDNVQELLEEFAWRSWTTIGVAGAVQPFANVGIDPEALILLTSALGKADTRLRDEAIDWCTQFHGVVVSARFRALVAGVPKQYKQPFSRFLATVNANSRAKWPAEPNTNAYEVSPSGKSNLNLVQHGPLIRLRLRYLFGVGSRAETIASFLSRKAAAFTAAELTSTGFTKRNVALVLEDLRRGGLLETRADGNRLVYFLTKGDELLELVSPVPKSLAQWGHVTRFCLAIHHYARRTVRSAGVRSVEAREIWADVKADFQMRRLDGPGWSNDVEETIAEFESWSLAHLLLLSTGRSRLLAGHIP